MSTVKITRIEDIRPGDRVTLVWNGDNDTTVSGIVHTVDSARRLGVVDRLFQLGDSSVDWHVTAATREVPDAPPLPTEEGSVIIATIRGEAGHAAFLDDGGDWRSLRPVGDGFYLHSPKDITAWEPGRIVPEGGAS